MSTYPQILLNNENLEIIIAPSGELPRHIDVEFVLDFNQFREVVGIEILDLKEEAGRCCLEKIESIIGSPELDLKYSYDKDTDSFYLHLTGERSIDQEAVDGVLVLNHEGQIVGFKT